MIREIVRSKKERWMHRSQYPVWYHAAPECLMACSFARVSVLFVSKISVRTNAVLIVEVHVMYEDVHVGTYCLLVGTNHHLLLAISVQDSPEMR